MDRYDRWTARASSIPRPRPDHTWTAHFIDPGVTNPGEVTLTTQQPRSVPRNEEGKECGSGTCEKTSNRLELVVKVDAVEESTCPCLIDGGVGADDALHDRIDELTLDTRGYHPRRRPYCVLVLSGTRTHIACGLL